MQESFRYGEEDDEGYDSEESIQRKSNKMVGQKFGGPVRWSVYSSSYQGS